MVHTNVAVLVESSNQSSQRHSHSFEHRQPLHPQGVTIASATSLNSTTTQQQQQQQQQRSKPPRRRQNSSRMTMKSVFTDDTTNLQYQRPLESGLPPLPFHVANYQPYHSEETTNERYLPPPKGGLEAMWRANQVLRQETGGGGYGAATTVLDADRWQKLVTSSTRNNNKEEYYDGSKTLSPIGTEQLFDDINNNNTTAGEIVSDYGLSASPNNNWTRPDSWKGKHKSSRSVSFRDETLASLLQRPPQQQQQQQQQIGPQQLAWLAAFPPPPAPSKSLLQALLKPETNLTQNSMRGDVEERGLAVPDLAGTAAFSPSEQDVVVPTDSADSELEDFQKVMEEDKSLWATLSRLWAAWMFYGVQWDVDGMPYFDDDLGTWKPNLPAWFRYLIFNPIYPEFTAIQQACWAVMIGITMGVFTALWQHLIEHCVEFLWKTIPELLLRYNILTDLNGSFPLPYYMVLCPTVCGCVLSYINVILPTKVPSQNDWIQSTHNHGVIDSSSFWHMFFLSTAGMASGLSLGPELPLVLLGGMYGSWLGLVTKQSVLQARVLNLTAASAMVSGFFGFPMAGGLFVLEIPHRMGLQYFEALSPATFSSIVAVIANRMVTGNDVKGYFHYPFLTLSLPSRIFVSAIVYGAFGSLVGILYGKGVTFLKGAFHELFHDSHPSGSPDGATKTNSSPDVSLSSEEEIPLVKTRNSTQGTTEKGMQHVEPRNITKKPLFTVACCTFRSICRGTIPHEPTRAAVVGTIAGFLVGVTGMFLPYVMFWGESQLQTLIDKGRTPLPIFGRGNEPTANLTAYGFCMVNPADPQAVKEGFGLGCSALITFAKIWTTGVSLGTGIVAGQFWGPLFTGCAAGHFFTEIANRMQQHLGFGGWLAAHPCVAILCIMGSSHVVTFRAHAAIALLLTLTITSFDSELGVGKSSTATAGDYSAVFPLLVVAVYVSFILARDYVFYTAQQARGDILALPEVLCEPKKMGRPLAFNYYDDVSAFDDTDDPTSRFSGRSSRNSISSAASSTSSAAPMSSTEANKGVANHEFAYNDFSASGTTDNINNSKYGSAGVRSRTFAESSKITEGKKKRGHFRSYSAPIMEVDEEETNTGPQTEFTISASLLSSLDPKTPSPLSENVRKQLRRGGSISPRSGDTTRTPSPGGKSLVQVLSFGEVVNRQPSLLDQARISSASEVSKHGQGSRHRRYPSLPKFFSPSLSSTSESSIKTMD